ncbi:MAG: ATP-binding protein [Spirochaetaceae bacterium]
MKKPGILLHFLPFIILVSFLIGAYTDFSRKVSDERHDMIQQLALTESNINKVTNYNISKMIGVATYIGLNTDVDIEELDYFVQKVLPSENNIISNIGIFEDTKAIYLYPYEPNKSMININLAELPAFRDDAFIVKNDFEVVITQPDEVIQGGVGIVTRLPIVLPNGLYWGQIGYMMKLDDIVESLFLNTDKYTYLITQYNNYNSLTHIVYDSGFEDNFLVDEVVINLPSGFWIVNIAYNNLFELISPVFYIMIFSSILFFGLSIYIISKFKRSERQLHSIMDSISAFIFVMTDTGVFLSVNKSMLNSLGLNEKDIIGKSYKNDSLKDLPGFNFFENFKFKNINEIYSAYDVSYLDQYNEKKWVHITLQRIKINTFGEPVIIGTSIDLTKEKELQETVIHEKKMAAVGRMAGGIAHDFNNNLLQIQSAKDLLLINNESFNKKSLEYIDIIQLASDKLSNLTSKLSSYSKKGSWIKSPVDFHKLIVNLISENKTKFSGNVTIIQELTAILYSVLGDIKELEKAVYNIILNSIESFSNNGEIKINTKNIIIDTKVKINNNFTLSPGNHLIIEIEDNGCGINEEIVDNIFDPFVTTKEIGKGLGLSAVMGIISDHNGSIDIKSQVGIKTNIKITLPVLLNV